MRNLSRSNAKSVLHSIRFQFSQQAAILTIWILHRNNNKWQLFSSQMLRKEADYFCLPRRLKGVENQNAHNQKIMLNTYSGSGNGQLTQKNSDSFRVINGFLKIFATLFLNCLIWRIFLYQKPFQDGVLIFQISRVNCRLWIRPKKYYCR